MGVMAGSPRKLTVILSKAALASLDQIWLWNAKKYGRDHAQRYIDFLEAETSKHSTEYLTGRQVSSNPGAQYIVIKRSRKGHGHIAVYEVVGDDVHVIDYFRTAESWEEKLDSG